MAKAAKGRAGCGCLLFVLVLFMIGAAALVHPFSLKLIAGRLHQEDRIVPCDAIYVPRFAEDRNGEVYVEAFRQYWAGNGKVIYVENDRVFGLSMKDIVERMAKERGIKEGAVRALDVAGDSREKAAAALAALRKQGVKKLVLVVPGYASRRYRALYGSDGNDGVLVLVRPVPVSYFKADRWWKDDVSRGLFVRELYRTAVLYIDRFRGDGKKG